jgi:phosphomannomutase
MQDLGPIVKAYDVRGIVPEQLNADTARALGRAAAVELQGSGFVVARDMRPTGVELAQAFMEGVRQQGVDTIDLGLASTDMIYYAAGRLGVPGGMWTASHNPAQYNGLKLCKAGAEPVGIETGLAAVRDRAQAEDFPPATRTGSASSMNLLGEYGQHVRSFVDPTKMRRLKVAVDAGNGMAGYVVPTVFEGLPIDLVPLYFELDGSFPNHEPNPIIPENLRDLQRAVVAEGADVGLAFDGDADRMFAVDERGEPVSPSLITALIAEDMLRKNPGATILYNLIVSRVVPETIRAHGGKGVRTRVGHSYIKQVMKETGGLFAGEHSGHFYFRDNYRADSGLIAAVILLGALGATDAPMSQLIAPYDRYVASGEINTQVADIDAAIERVGAAFEGEGEVDRTDGLTVDADRWWFNLRPSNTEPLLRLNAEAEDEATMTSVRDRVLGLIRT